MGLCLYVSTLDEKSKSFGKLFGYADEDEHLYSLDYLIEIDAFKDWQKNMTFWETTSYEDMTEFFVHAQTTDKIYLTPRQYNRFIMLYLSDRLNSGRIELEDIADLISKAIYKGKAKEILLEWC